jgi:hypothetical protein
MTSTRIDISVPSHHHIDFSFKSTSTSSRSVVYFRHCYSLMTNLQLHELRTYRQKFMHARSSLKSILNENEWILSNVYVKRIRTWQSTIMFDKSKSSIGCIFYYEFYLMIAIVFLRQSIKHRIMMYHWKQSHVYIVSGYGWFFHVDDKYARMNCLPLILFRSGIKVIQQGIKMNSWLCNRSVRCFI